MVQKVACANGKGIKKTIKIETQIHPKIYEKSIQISCSKKDTQNIENNQQSENKKGVS